MSVKQQPETTDLPFGVTVEDFAATDIDMLQRTFGVALPYHDIARQEHLVALCQHFPLLAELPVKVVRS
ncbi:cellulose biosynthesis protein BcsR [Aeromonas simiae]|uniref:cellulose biosynthesis protein BcsR n=1 Tax=Aeromonas simiae TaxID=218936 RepID=UPI0005AB249B|nr:cellulose biosynthesis protein BcsR [Aeromonas simiae]MDO2948614.1 cellulose biosynthesis protein BcsR [Aeromonas simiae]MDO2952066.1 cellulose biosynthesis protein BcsR [Aeromonas simiae]MDO2955997.1 cellulose biosynthesis protein BcsR [Aeromonas simiae]